MLYLKNLIDHSAKIGADKTLVQGAGGNTSLKLNQSLWIKSSGTKLEDALKKNIFVELDLKKAIRYSVYDDVNEINKALVNPDSNLRPSIETAMHSLIDFPVVTHVHSLGALSIAVQNNPDKEIKKLNEIVSAIFIPYLKPGAELARTIQEKIKAHHRVLILGNHGMTVWGEDFEEVENIIYKIELYLRGDNFEFKNTSKSSPEWAENLCKGILTPDELIFLGEKPYELEHLEEDESKSLFKISKYGDIKLIKDINQDQSDISQLLINLGNILPENTKLNFLTQDNIKELINWEMEKYRKDLNS